MKFTKIFLFTLLIVLSFGFISRYAFATEISGSASIVVGDTTFPPTPDLKASVNFAYITVTNSDGPITISYSSPYTLSWGKVDNATSCILDGFYTADVNGGSVTWGPAANWANDNHDFILSCTDANGIVGTDTVNLNYPPAPTDVKSSCSADGKTATISWTNVPGYDLQYTRAYPGPYRENVPWADYILYDDNSASTSASFDVIPNQDYVAWVHTRLSSGVYSAGAFAQTINCPSPAPICTPTETQITDINGNCVECPAGKTPDRSTNTCKTTSCTPTATQIKNIDGSCVECPSGSVANKSTNKCDSCSITQIVDVVNSACQECPPGEYAERTTNVCQFVICLPNEIIDPNTGLCTPCPVGQTANKITNLCKKAFNYIEN